MHDTFRSQLREIGETLTGGGPAFDRVSGLRDLSDDLVADLIEALLDIDPLIQAAAAFSLGHLWYVFHEDGYDAAVAIPNLMPGVDHEDLRVAFESVRSVHVLQIGGKVRVSKQRVMAVYAHCLKDGDFQLKCEAATQLLSLEPDVAVFPAIAQLLDDPEVREAVHEAIDGVQDWPVLRLPNGT